MKTTAIMLALLLGAGAPQPVKTCEESLEATTKALAAEKANHKADRLKGQQALRVRNAQLAMQDATIEMLSTKLSARTPTVTIALTVPPLPRQEERPDGPSAFELIGGGALLFGLGVLAGALIVLKKN